MGGGRGVAKSPGVLKVLEGVRTLHGVEGMPPAGAILEVSASSAPDTLSNSCAQRRGKRDDFFFFFE